MKTNSASTQLNGDSLDISLYNGGDDVTVNILFHSSGMPHADVVQLDMVYTDISKEFALKKAIRSFAKGVKGEISVQDRKYVDTSSLLISNREEPEFKKSDYFQLHALNYLINTNSPAEGTLDSFMSVSESDLKNFKDALNRKASFFKVYNGLLLQTTAGQINISSKNGKSIVPFNYDTKDSIEGKVHVPSLIEEKLNLAIRGLFTKDQVDEIPSSDYCNNIPEVGLKRVAPRSFKCLDDIDIQNFTNALSNRRAYSKSVNEDSFHTHYSVEKEGIVYREIHISSKRGRTVVPFNYSLDDVRTGKVNLQGLTKQNLARAIYKNNRLK